MAARSSGSTRSHLRLGLAFAASLALHGLLLFPFGVAPVRVAALPEWPLEARLTAPVLITRSEAVESELSEPEPVDLPSELPKEATVAVPPAPTFEPPRPAYAPPPPQPRALDGRRRDNALAAMARDEFYPREAIERGIEGTVTLLLTLDGSGRVMALSLAGSSGHALLDEAALRAARRIANVPGSRGQVLLPVEFRLE